MATAVDWLTDVRRYAADADADHVAGVVRYCGIALRNRDSSLVSFSDPTELGRVRERFLKKKLGLDHDDGVLDAAISRIGETMKGDRTKNRVTVYYLLAQHYDKLSLFLSAAARKTREGAGSPAAPASAAPAPTSPPPQSLFAAEPEHAATPSAPATASGGGSDSSVAESAAPSPVSTEEPPRPREPAFASSQGAVSDAQPKVASPSSAAPAAEPIRSPAPANDGAPRQEPLHSAYGATHGTDHAPAPLTSDEAPAEEAGEAWPWWAWLLVALAVLLLIMWLLGD